MTRRLFATACVLALFGAALVGVPEARPWAAAPALAPLKARADYESYKRVIAETAGMVGDPEAIRLAGAHKLSVLNLTWEDTGRFKNSAVGPNISDMTIQVQHKHPETKAAYLTCMPVIRFPNFTDRTADVRLEKFYLMVGNEAGGPLRRVSLERYLANVRRYLSKPASWKGDRTYLLAPRDTHALVSAQACFLPVPKQGIAEFNPVLFNYQSRPGDPAVLAILATPEGTSATVIDNQRDGFQAPGGAWGQRLFFNGKGERSSLTGQRLSDVKALPPDKPIGKPGRPTSPPGTVEAAGQTGLNVVLLIQVPLKQKERPRREALGETSYLAMPKSGNKEAAKKAERKSDVEEAVIGHGKVEGPFTEMADLPIERDPRFPVRVTVQFYKATSNGVVDEKDLKAIAEQIERVYQEGDFVGSLVTQGRIGRPTEHDGEQIEPAEWWEDFWAQFQQRTGRSRADVVAEVREAKGEAWFPLTERELATEAEQLAFPERAWLDRLLSGRGKYVAAGVGLALALVVGAAYLRRRARQPA
jgi:hypothetical protein